MSTGHGHWSEGDWPTGPPPAGVDLGSLLDEVMDPDGALGATRAVVVVHGGRIVAERYGDRTDAFGETTGAPVDADTPLISWSMAKSMLHAVVGMRVLDGAMSLEDPVDDPRWPAGDPRQAITLDVALAMRDGLDFVEDYDPDSGRSDVIAMLFGDGVADTAAFAADRPLIAAPGERFNYSSGTSNVVSAAVARTFPDGDAYRRYLHERLFGPLGMATADPRFDDAGTWIASSYVWATARDMARFGSLYLHDGCVGDRRLLPEGWVAHGTTKRSVDAESGNGYGAHWWVDDDHHASFWASGYEGQSITVAPSLDVVVVRLGKSEAGRYPVLHDWRRRVLDAFATR